MVHMETKTQTQSDKTRIFLVDDQAVVLRGLQLLLHRQGHLAVCGTARKASDALQQVQLLAPELAVVDLNLGHGEEDGIKLIRQLRRHCPKLKILVFSMRGEIASAQAAFHAGAHGYVNKEEGAETLLEGLAVVLAGKPYFSPMIAAQMPDAQIRPGPGIHKTRH
jgi:DNA-binding NarL/FixJ family response regulator